MICNMETSYPLCSHIHSQMTGVGNCRVSSRQRAKVCRRKMILPMIDDCPLCVNEFIMNFLYVTAAVYWYSKNLGAVLYFRA